VYRAAFYGDNHAKKVEKLKNGTLLANPGELAGFASGQPSFGVWDSNTNFKRFFDLRSKLGKAMTKVFEAEGFNYAWNEGEVAGQFVPHLHLHMLPRKKGDKGIYKYEPRKFLYRTGTS